MVKMVEFENDQKTIILKLLFNLFPSYHLWSESDEAGIEPSSSCNTTNGFNHYAIASWIKTELDTINRHDLALAENILLALYETNTVQA